VHEIVFSSGLDLRGLGLLDHASLGRGFSMAPSGNAAPMASETTIFMSIDSFLSGPRLLARCLACTSSFARASGEQQ
jgi:hypothetical protein